MIIRFLFLQKNVIFLFFSVCDYPTIHQHIYANYVSRLYIAYCFIVDNINIL